MALTLTNFRAIGMDAPAEIHVGDDGMVAKIMAGLEIADLGEEQLARIRSLEDELGVTLLVYQD